MSSALINQASTHSTPTAQQRTVIACSVVTDLEVIANPLYRTQHRPSAVHFQEAVLDITHVHKKMAMAFPLPHFATRAGQITRSTSVLRSRHASTHSTESSTAVAIRWVRNIILLVMRCKLTEPKAGSFVTDDLEYILYRF